VKVVVTKIAFFGGSRVRPGTELEVPDTLKGSWFAKVDTPEAKGAKAPRAKATKDIPETLSEMARPAATTFSDAHQPLA
jgi:hypothetical protein